MKTSEAERKAKGYYAKTANNKAGCPERIAEAHKVVVWVRQEGYIEVEPTVKVLGSGRYGTFNVAGIADFRMVPFLKYGDELLPYVAWGEQKDYPKKYRDASCYGFWQRFEPKPVKNVARTR